MKLFFMQTLLNTLVHCVHYKGRLTKILILEGILKKNSYQRRGYESVDEKILYHEKQRKKTSCSNGLTSIPRMKSYSLYIIEVED